MTNDFENDSLPATQYIRPVWSAPDTVSVLTTTRKGGVSTGPYASMNLGMHVGDQHDAVLENRRRLMRLLPGNGAPYWLNQTHSNTVISVDLCSENNEGDGAYTRTPGIVLTVLTADCLPVVLTNKAGTELAVVHAGWRGLAGGILANAVAHFRDRAGLCAWLGPAIGAAAFEVGGDVKQAYTDRMVSNEKHFKPGLTASKYWCDLYALAGAELRESGCNCIDGGDYCTYSQSDTFHSHRRDGIPSGRMATVAWLS